MAKEKQVYVSITGLKISRRRHIPAFWWHAIRSMIQAKSSPGNISADARKINGVHHTVSVWTDEDAMRAFLTTGNHLKAMKDFSRIATGKTFGYHTEKTPNWDEVPKIWSERGIAYPKTSQGFL